MSTLAIDTATSQVSVAVVVDGRVAAGEVGGGAVRHVEQLVPLIDRVVAAAPGGRAGITQIVVGVGPGPFTGLRVGLVTAQVIGQVLGVPVIGAGTLDGALVELDETAAGTGGRLVTGRRTIVLPARRREVYWARFADGRRVAGPDIAPVGQPLVGAEADDVTLTDAPGNWAARLALGVAQGWIEAVAPRPEYLRAPDARPPAGVVLPDTVPRPWLLPTYGAAGDAAGTR